VSGRRETSTIEFTPPETAGVEEALRRLRTAGNGWINLLPGIEEGAVALEPQAGLFAFFGTRAPPVTMATIMPARKDRRDSEGLTVGLMHPTGAKAVGRLAEVGGGAAVPTDWVVRQDHVRRGLVLRTPVGVAEADVITWCVKAGTALCRADMTGRWRAVVYLP
jgi:hypothetical protein